MQQEYIKIGKFAGIHGLKGELVLTHHLGKKTTLKDVKALFLQERNGGFLPYFPEKVTARSDEESWVILEGVHTREQAMRFLQKEVWLLKADTETQVAGHAPLSLLGYTIFEGKQKLGVVEEVFEQPHQVLCKLIMQGKEVLVPLHEQTLRGIRHKDKTILVELPEGLLALYLES